MSIQSEIERISENIANTYSVLSEAGASMPQSRTSDNLAETAANIKAVLYGKEQSLTEAQKAQARKNIGFEYIPEYVNTEAMSVLDKVVSAQGSRTFVLGAITDMHYGSSNYTDGVLHACQGMKHIAKRIKLDAIAVLGDYTDEAQMNNDAAITDLEEVNALLDRFCDNDNLRVKGNHDHRAGFPGQTYRYIMANSDDVVWGSRIGGYFYRDFTEYKLRVICLNTPELSKDNVSVSDEQYNFFIDTLDLSAKDDAEEWGILILSHHPLDFTTSDGVNRFGNIVNAYQTGGSWTNGTISCNYADKNAAKIVCNIHGHLHNLLTDRLYYDGGQTSVWRMCVPASRVDAANHYTGIWHEDTTYNKTPNTADDTSFNIFCIDLDSYTVKAFCYGAGYDRELTYYEEIVNLVDTYGYKDNTRIKSDGSYVTEAGYAACNKIPVTKGDVIYAGGLNYDAKDYSRGNAFFWYSTYTGYTVTNSNDKTNWDHADRKVSMSNGIVKVEIVSSNIKYIGFTGYGSGANMIVTKNQVITA